MSGDMRERQDRADRLQALLVRGPQTWRALAEAGLSGDEAAIAARDIAARGQWRVRLGPQLVEFESMEDFPP